MYCELRNKFAVYMRSTSPNARQPRPRRAASDIAASRIRAVVSHEAAVEQLEVQQRRRRHKRGGGSTALLRPHAAKFTPAVASYPGPTSKVHFRNPMTSRVLRADGTENLECRPVAGDSFRRSPGNEATAVSSPKTGNCEGTQMQSTVRKQENMDATMEVPVSRMAPYRTAAARLFSPIQRVLDANTAIPTHMSGSVHHTASGEQPFPFSVLGCAGQMLAQLNSLFHLEREYPVLYHAILEEPAAGLAGFLDSAYPTGLASATTLELAEVLAPDTTSGHRPAYSMDCTLGASNFRLWRRIIADEEEISSDLKRQRAKDNFVAFATRSQPQQLQEEQQQPQQSVKKKEEEKKAEEQQQAEPVAPPYKKRRG